MILFAALLGIGYPLAMTGIGQVIFPHQANGSLVVDAGRIVGSEVVGQTFASDRYVQMRPSAAGKGYDGLASSGSNLGPASQALVDRVVSDLATRSVSGRPVRADLVKAAASGLDPDLSPQAALYRAPRACATRGIDEARVRAIIDAHVERPLPGVLGELHGNVLALDRALDRGIRTP